VSNKWIGLVGVVLAGAVIIAFKLAAPLPTASAPDAAVPSVLLVADLREAGSGGRCAKIIDAVRAIRARGVSTAEFMPDSASPLIARYRVVSAPTVVIIDERGRETARYEGEDEGTVAAVTEHLAKLGRE